MSMWLNVAVVSAPAFEKLRTDDALMQALFFPDLSSNDEDGTWAAVLEGLGLDEDAVAGCDYLTLAGAGDGEQPGFAETGELSFDAGYGPAFFVAPKDLASLSNEAWSMVSELDEEVEALLARARKKQLYVIAVIS